MKKEVEGQRGISIPFLENLKVLLNMLKKDRKDSNLDGLTEDEKAILSKGKLEIIKLEHEYYDLPPVKSGYVKLGKNKSIEATKGNEIDKEGKENIDTLQTRLENQKGNDDEIDMDI